MGGKIDEAMKNNNSTPCAKATEGAVGVVILCLRTQGSSWSLSALTRTHRSTGQLQDYCFMREFEGAFLRSADKNQSCPRFKR